VSWRSSLPEVFMFESAAARLAGGPDAPTIERRADERRPCRLAAECRALGYGAAPSWPAEVLDIATGGLGLRLGRRFQRGALVAVTLRDTAGAVRLRRTGWVSRVHPEGPGACVVGIAFARELTPEELADCAD